MFRCLAFPLIMKGQREVVKINNHMPQITRLTNIMNDARCSGNQFECEWGWERGHGGGGVTAPELRPLSSAPSLMRPFLCHPSQQGLHGPDNIPEGQ